MNLAFKTQDDSEEIREIVKNLEVICSVREGSIPMARGLGLNWTALDDVPMDMENEYATDLIAKVEAFEPRVIVEECTFEHSPDGETTATAIIRRAGSYGT